MSARAARHRFGALALLGAWCALLAATLTAMAPGGSCGEWLADMPPELHPAATALRAVAGIASLHLLAATLTSVLAAALPSARRIATVLGSPAFVRRLAAAAISASLTAGSAVAGAAPQPTTTSTIVADEPFDAAVDEVISLRRAPTTKPPGEASPPTTRRSPTWDVEPGDHLWSIAHRTVARDLGRPPTEHEVHRYWVLLIEANRDRFGAEGDPDLIYSRQTFELPPPSGMTPLGED